MNEIKDLSDTLDGKDMMENIMRTLLECYNDKISAIEETYDPSKFTREWFYGTLTRFGMRKFGKDKAITEIAFEILKDMDENSDDEILDEMEAKICYLLNFLSVERLVIMHLDVQIKERHKSLKKIKKIQ